MRIGIVSVWSRYFGEGWAVAEVAGRLLLHRVRSMHRGRVSAVVSCPCRCARAHKLGALAVTRLASEAWGVFKVVLVVSRHREGVRKNEARR